VPGGARTRAALLAILARTRPGPGGGQLTRLCQEIAEGLGVPRVALRLTEHPTEHLTERLTGGRLLYQWPPGTASRWAPRLAVRSFTLSLGGEQLGVLSVDPGVLRRISGKRARLLAEVVDVLGAVLYEARLQREFDQELDAAREHAERIAAARRQAFAERDQERRDLERDLHDGAQHHLVALKMVVGLLELQLSNGDRPGVAAGQARLRSGLEQTELTLLGTAAGICPPVLVQHGLVAALTTEFQDDARQVSVRAEAPTAARRFPLAFETAVYFTCLEAVNNARKHAPGAQVTVLLREGAEGLAFAVTDDGPGLTGHSAQQRGQEWQEPLDSFGLGNMRDRIVAAGGQLELRTATGAGTTIEGFIPI
jgi:signal transduction histidine kinase